MSRAIKLRTPGKRAFTDKEEEERPQLRLVSEQSARPVGPDPELKALLEQLQQPRKLVRKDDDEPDAA